MRNNYATILNKNFIKRNTIKKNIFKVFNFKYGYYNFKTLFQLKNKKYSDFLSFHLTQPFLKSSFEIVWDKEYSLLDNSCYNKFRANTDIGCGIVRYWQLLTGKFSPYHSLGKYFTMKNNNQRLTSIIRKQKYFIICINDADNNINFEEAKLEINKSLEEVFPNKSNFEK